MLAPSVIIVTSGQADSVPPGTLDLAIQTILNIGKNPIVVLGPDGDKFLRESKLSEHCEVIFDPNYDGGTFSSVKAGLFATNNAAFVVGLLNLPQGPEVWRTLESELRGDKAKTFDVLKSDFTPILITARGVKNLKMLDAHTDWENSERVAACEIALRQKPE